MSEKMIRNHNVNQNYESDAHMGSNRLRTA